MVAVWGVTVASLCNLSSVSWPPPSWETAQGLGWPLAAPLSTLACLPSSCAQRLGAGRAACSTLLLPAGNTPEPSSSTPSQPSASTSASLHSFILRAPWLTSQNTPHGLPADSLFWPCRQAGPADPTVSSAFWPRSLCHGHPGCCLR